MSTSLKSTDKVRQSQARSAEQKLLPNSGRAGSPAQLIRADTQPNSGGHHLTSGSWPWPHKLPSRAHPSPITSAHLDVIYRPKLHRNCCLQLPWQQGCGKSPASGQWRFQGRLIFFTQEPWTRTGCHRPGMNVPSDCVSGS
jgi:hypothetical protein